MTKHRHPQPHSHPPHSHRHPPPYPRVLVRFDGLQGGQSGFLALTASSDDLADLQLGADFVRLTRAQAAELRGGLVAFLDLEEDERSERPPHRQHYPEGPHPTVLVKEVVGEAVEEIVEELMTTERSPSSPPPSHEPRRRGRGRSS